MVRHLLSVHSNDFYQAAVILPGCTTCAYPFYGGTDKGQSLDLLSAWSLSGGRRYYILHAAVVGPLTSHPIQDRALSVSERSPTAIHCFLMWQNVAKIVFTYPYRPQPSPFWVNFHHHVRQGPFFECGGKYISGFDRLVARAVRTTQTSRSPCEPSVTTKRPFHTWVYWTYHKSSYTLANKLTR